MVARFPRFPVPSRSNNSTGPRLVRSSNNLLTWPVEPSVEAVEPVEGTIPVSAEVRVKRFSGTHQLDRSECNATLQARNASPAAMVSAIAQILNEDNLYAAPSLPGDPIIVEIRMVL